MGIWNKMGEFSQLLWANLLKLPLSIYRILDCQFK